MGQKFKFIKVKFVILMYIAFLTILKKYLTITKSQKYYLVFCLNALRLSFNV